MKLQEIKTIVLELLSNDERCKSDDIYLYTKVAELICKQQGTYTDSVRLCLEVLRDHKNNCFPNPMTVIRARQKLQSERPELKIEEIAKERQKQEYTFRGFFRR